MVVQSTTGVSLVSSQNPASAGSSVMFTAAVGGSSVTATGTVTFRDGSAVLGATSLNGAGEAFLTTAGLALGTHPITASYAGDANNSAAVSSILNLVVQRSATQTSLAVSSINLTVGSPVTLSTSVTGAGAVPGGQVTFLDGSTVLGTANLNASGSAALTVPNLALGQQALAVSYSGDTNDAPSVSAAQVVTVQKGLPSLVVASSSNPSFTGQAVTLTASLAGVGGTPTGSVTWSDGSTVLGSSSLSSSGSSSYVATALTAGQHILTAGLFGRCEQQRDHSGSVCANGAAGDQLRGAHIRGESGDLRGHGGVHDRGRRNGIAAGPERSHSGTAQRSSDHILSMRTGRP